MPIGFDRFNILISFPSFYLFLKIFYVESISWRLIVFELGCRLENLAANCTKIFIEISCFNAV
ncbi:hypothetical protein AUF14_21995 [Enterococcus avium]|nr:hypothetical protein HMPREF3146_13500 [Enterococcus sp. HMSC05C03]PNE44750.1 hypothetical protein AUF14_21995 [Enterococcus avium]RGY42115.1 hypothetical protein DXA45_07895 [Enterococcus avium]